MMFYKQILMCIAAKCNKQIPKQFFSSSEAFLVLIVKIITHSKCLVCLEIYWLCLRVVKWRFQIFIQVSLQNRSSAQDTKRQHHSAVFIKIIRIIQVIKVTSETKAMKVIKGIKKRKEIKCDTIERELNLLVVLQFMKKGFVALPYNQQMVNYSDNIWTRPYIQIALSTVTGRQNATYMTFSFKQFPFTIVLFFTWPKAIQAYSFQNFCAQ